MEEVEFTCKNCSCHSYTIQDGFYYCDDCGYQNEQQQIHDDFAIRKGDVTRLKGTANQTGAEGQKKRTLTSWEAYNYVMKGLTEEMCRLGAPPGFRTTVFQLWAHYLRLHQVAFFSKEEAALPRMGLMHKKRDRELIYNFQPATRKRKRSTAGSQSSRAKKRKLTSLINLSQTSDYNSAMASNRSLNASSLGDMSASDIRSLATSSKSSANTVELEFSDKAKATMLKKMSHEHLMEHARDFLGELKCHKTMLRYLQNDNLRKVELGMNLLYVFLAIALDVHETDYRITDILRFRREGHLTSAETQHFFPTTVDPADVAEATKLMHRQKQIQYHFNFRTRLFHLSQMLGVEQRVPDMYDLCSRFVDELALPAELKVLVNRIICFVEPKFSKKTIDHKQNFNSCQFYEGRAVAYIIFLLKLLFGLDGKTEKLLSDSAKEVNKKLEQPLFVFTEWVDYIEMRKHVIKKFHPPTQFRITGITNCHGDARRHIHETKLKVQQEYGAHEDDDEEPTTHEPALFFIKKAPDRAVINRYNFMKEFLAKLELLYPTSNENTITFEPSLTPFKSYLETIFQHHPELREQFPHNQTDTGLFPYLEPDSLRAHFDALNMTLHTEMVQVAEHVTYQKHRRPKLRDEFQKRYNSADMTKIRTKGVDVRMWLCHAVTRERRRRADKQEHQEKYHRSAKAEFERYRDVMQEKFCKPVPSTNGHDSHKEKITFLTPNYDVWLNHVSIYYYSKTMFDELEQDFPEIFAWLLEECSFMVESNSLDIYSQLMCIENYFTHVLSPVQNCEVAFRNLDELPQKVRTIAKNGQDIW